MMEHISKLKFIVENPILHQRGTSGYFSDYCVILQVK